MQRIGERLIFSASDLNDFLECAPLSELERKAAFGEIVRPDPSESAALVARKGDEHERRYLETLRQMHGENLVEFPPPAERSIESLVLAERQTVAAMESGAEIIYQATFFDGSFLGRTDFLRKIETPSARFPWSYEVIDTKLAHSAKPYFLVQLCNYSEHLARVQGAMPAYASIVHGSGIEQRFVLAEYEAYYRHLKERFLSQAITGANGSYPHEVGHCQICRWNPICEARRDADDYLGIVATMRRDAIRKFQGSGIETIAALAAASDAQRPPGMNAHTFARLRDQARLQHRQRATGERVYELLPPEPDRGFALLPQPDPGDVFFDMEGDPLYTAERGLEYLFGVYVPLEDRYLSFLAHDSSEELRALEGFMDFLVERRSRHPAMHVYHYAPYEPTALKRLCGRYASREEDLDVLLRAQTFVDLYSVVRQGVRVSQPSYSIKKLEPFYGFTRSTKTQRGDDSILMFESWLVERDASILRDIEAYNRDDCVSTHRLRDWLLERREELVARSAPMPWRAAPEAKAPEPPSGPDVERERLRAELLAGLTAPESAEQLRAKPEGFRARWLLGHLLDYHRRDEKPSWWAYFHRCDNRDELVEFDREAIGGLHLNAEIAPYKNGGRNLIYVYDFPEQQHALGEGDKPWLLDAGNAREAGTIVTIDEERLHLHLRVSGRTDPSALDALSPRPTIPSGPLRDSLLRTASLYLEGKLESERRALYDLLLSRRPHFRHPELPGRSLGELALSLDDSYLFVQGPPGSGKSTKGAAMIVDLIAAGKRVAILANAHKAIHNLLHKIEKEAVRRGIAFRGIQRYTDASPSSLYQSELERSFVVPSSSNDALLEPHDLAAGTAWVWARNECAGSYDHLVIDEAGQVSLANAVACAPCARNVILLGDPLQLAQVSQGSHPPGIELSVLEHLLGEATTVSPDRGVFLEESYRMHPQICDFISRAVYDGRLRAAASTRSHRVESPGLHGSGLRYIGIEHAGNSRESAEEADAIVAEIVLLLRGSFTLDGSSPQPLSQRDVLVVSPYNAQRLLIRAKLRSAGFDEIRVGTVDKFQGQQAPVVFYSMATSSGDDVPRGIGFLFERNRFNVAISRAQCMSVLVCSPRLLEIVCSTPEQMSLVNLLCAFKDAASAS
jgi:predicted RecB family nuclease